MIERLNWILLDREHKPDLLHARYIDFIFRVSFNDPMYEAHARPEFELRIYTVISNEPILKRDFGTPWAAFEYAEKFMGERDWEGDATA